MEMYLMPFPFIFGRDCLRSVIKMSEDPQVACPYRDDLYACNCTLQEREIRAVRAVYHCFDTTWGLFQNMFCSFGKMACINVIELWLLSFGCFLGKKCHYHNYHYL